MKKRLTFIDAYAGIGGFHSAMSKLNGVCVAAIEYDDSLREIYGNSYNVKTLHKDFRTFSKRKNEFNVDWFFAGFPCQPFSKAGARLGFSDPVNGDHFKCITEFLKNNIIENVLLENVPNLLTHDHNNSIAEIHRAMRKLKYKPIFSRELSPHEIGIPLHRPRLFMLFTRNPDIKVNHDDIEQTSVKSIFDFLEGSVDFSNNEHINSVLDRAFDLLRDYSNNEKNIVPKPLWLDESYHDGNEYINNQVPKYHNEIQNWKSPILRRNRNFFSENGVSIEFKHFIEEPLSRRKIEYNSGDLSFSKSEKIVQLRPSGIRISDRPYLPTIVRSSTQIPWIFHPVLKRFVQCSEKDLLKLNGIKLNYDEDQKNIVYKALGNCVNGNVVNHLIKNCYG